MYLGENKIVDLSVINNYICERWLLIKLFVIMWIFVL